MRLDNSVSPGPTGGLWSSQRALVCPRPPGDRRGRVCSGRSVPRTPYPSAKGQGNLPRLTGVDGLASTQSRSAGLSAAPPPDRAAPPPRARTLLRGATSHPPTE